MSEKEKPVFSLNVYERGEGDEKDYRIVATARTGGISMEFDQTVDDIRNFFTERRDRAEKKRLQKEIDKHKNKLKSVPKD